MHLKTFKKLLLCALTQLLLIHASAQTAALPATDASQANDAASATQHFPDTEWSQGDPVKMGWSTDRLADVKAYADRVGSTSLMIVQHGVVVAQWGDTQARTPLYSVRKSLLSALIGIAVARHQIDLNETLAQLGIDDNAPSLSPLEQQATVRELMEARSGVYHPTVYETPWMQEIKPERFSHAPGEFWCYNNWDFNTLGAIYEKAAGARIFDALEDEIARPIGMQDFRPSDGHYVSGEPASRYPAYPIRMSARDLARFALLFLHDGRWRDRQIVPADWVRESTHPYSDTPWGGYGYMWWTSTPASAASETATTRPIESYWADGHLGQYAIVVPSLDLVIVNRVDPKMTSRRVDERKREQLVSLIEAAAGASGAVK